jgi:hypothetical protein
MVQDITIRVYCGRGEVYIDVCPQREIGRHDAIPIFADLVEGMGSHDDGCGAPERSVHRDIPASKLVCQILSHKEEDAAQ